MSAARPTAWREATHDQRREGAAAPAEPERRSDALLGVARRLLREGGLAALNMAKIAESAGCSRPAVYQYFRDKDEVVVALAVESAALRNRLLLRAGSFDARPRERLVALSEVDAILYPDWPVLDETICANALRAGADSDRQETLRRAQRVAWGVYVECVRDAVAARDLKLARDVTEEHLVLTLTTFSIGLFAPLSRGLPHLEDERRDPRAALRRLGSAFLDGLGWRPLGADWDYRETMRRIYTDVFPPDLLRELQIEGSRPINRAGQRPSGARRRAQGAQS